MRLLLAVDGSRASERAARHVLALKTSGMNVRAVVLNVQSEPSNAEAAEQAMAPAVGVLKAGAVPFETTTHVGPVAESIVLIASLRRCDGIVMGARGTGVVGAAAPGPVAAKVVRTAAVPVTLVS